MPARDRDLAFEALVEVTRANPDFERGQLNRALHSIKFCCERDGIVDVAAEIRVRAEWYRETWPALTITPTALARHWYRVQPHGENLVEKWTKRLDDS